MSSINSTTGTEVTYGLALPADAEAMCAVRAGNLDGYLTGDLDTPEQRTWMQYEIDRRCGPENVREEERRIGLACDQSSNFYYRVARIDSELVGYLSGVRRHSIFPGHREIAGLHVRADTIGQGIGSKLLAFFFQEVGERSPTVLDTIQGVPAAGFYAVNGFREWHEQRIGTWGPFEVIRMRREAKA